jgi:tetratricopeptide (TPR) repeat protein
MSRNEEAYVLALKAKNLDPDNKWYKMNFANLAKTMEKYDEYVKTYEELVKQYPDNLGFLTELAYAYFYTVDYKNAVDQYHKIEEQVGINEPLTNQIANLYTRLGEYDTAVAEYEKLIKTDPENTHYYAILAEYCNKNKMPEKALWAYKQIEKINPDDPYVHISLADYYRNHGDTLKSFEELKLGMENKQLSLETKIQLLVSYYPGKLSEEQQKQALELSHILMKVHPDDPAAKSLYASMLYQNEKYGEAKTHQHLEFNSRE